MGIFWSIIALFGTILTLIVVLAIFDDEEN